MNPGLTETNGDVQSMEDNKVKKDEQPLAAAAQKKGTKGNSLSKATTGKQAKPKKAPAAAAKSTAKGTTT